MMQISFLPAVPYLVAVASLLLLAGSLALTPWILIRLPADYFTAHPHPPLARFRHRPVLRAGLLVLKNLAGGLLFLAGLSMLVLPGQGLLTLMMSLLVMDFPGKHTLKCRLFRIHKVRDWMNHFRIRHHCPPFE